MVCDHHYVHRCNSCGFDQTLPLPPLKKRIIYLEQHGISEMAKVLDSEKTSAAETGNRAYFRTLFKRLDRLSKLQLIVCPHSPIHNRESLVDTRYEKFQGVFRRLSHGVSFREPKTILHTQIRRSFDAWLADAPPESPFDRDFALTKNPDVWQSLYRIDLDSTLPGAVEGLKRRNAIFNERLNHLCEQWQQGAKLSFDETCDAIILAFANSLWEEYLAYQKHFKAVRSGQIPHRQFFLPPPGAELVRRMGSAARSALGVQVDWAARLGEFFASQPFRSISAIRTTALLWASIARAVKAGRRRYPTGGMYNDIDVVASYSPFCHAMFVDKEISHLVSQGELRLAFAGKPQFFSLRRGEREEFLAYLDAIEGAAPPEHLRIVNDVYGPELA
jgi:hypothetical protein